MMLIQLISLQCSNCTFLTLGFEGPLDVKRQVVFWSIWNEIVILQFAMRENLSAFYSKKKDFNLFVKLQIFRYFSKTHVKGGRMGGAYRTEKKIIRFLET
jgi:hypothetical protein